MTQLAWDLLGALVGNLVLLAILPIPWNKLHTRIKNMLDAINEDVNAGVKSQSRTKLCTCGHEWQHHQNPFKPGSHCTRLKCGCEKFNPKLYHVNIRNTNSETEDPAPKVLSKEEHIQHHLVLHAALDELAADWLQHNRGKTLSGTSILTLMEWSFTQTKDPTP